MFLCNKIGLIRNKFLFKIWMVIYILVYVWLHLLSYILFLESHYVSQVPGTYCVDQSDLEFIESCFLCHYI